MIYTRDQPLSLLCGDAILKKLNHSIKDNNNAGNEHHLLLFLIVSLLGKQDCVSSYVVLLILSFILRYNSFKYNSRRRYCLK